MNTEDKKKYVAELLKKNVLVSPGFLEKAQHDVFVEGDVVVIDEQASQFAKSNDVNWKEMEKVRVMYEQGQTDTLPRIDEIAPIEEKCVRVVKSFQSNPQKMGVQHFVNYFNTRYRLLEKILRSRPELQNLTALRRMSDRADLRNISVIGMVYDKQETKNKNIILTLEDSGCKQKVLINRNRPDLYQEGREIVPDEVVGINGSYRDKMMFANKIVFPDIPHKEVKKSPEEEYVAFMSDLHFGSRQFMEKEFKKFLKWVNKETGSLQQKEVADKLRYILVAGDIVDGVGIYQNQQDELTLTDVKEQYDMCTEYLSQIPEHISIVLSPGNHDSVRMAEPQPPIFNQFSESLKKLKNTTLVSNPATVNIGASDGFSGFNCLLYHGYSFDHFVANVDSVRLGGGYERADLLMKFLLKRRHLSPTHGATIIHPTPKEDALFIDPVPDFFVTGHIHRTSVSQYKATTLISGSCWQSMTSFQERLGHNPQPARLPLVNLKTRDARIINFTKN